MDWFDIAGKALVILAGSGISIKWVVDIRKSKNENSPVTHKELYDHAIGCSNIVHKKIDAYHNDVKTILASQGERISKVEGSLGI